MDHPTLTKAEKQIVDRASFLLGQMLLRGKVQVDRWPAVTLAVIVDLSGQVLRLIGHDTERPERLCDRYVGSAGAPRRHCTLPKGHEPDCEFE